MIMIFYMHYHLGTSIHSSIASKMLISIFWIYINKVVFIGATKLRTRSKEPWFQRTADLVARQSVAFKSRV